MSYGGGDSVNGRAEDDDWPDMSLPGIDHVVRAVLYWRKRYPGKRILIAKRDVDGAFRNIPFRPECVAEFGAFLGDYAVVMTVLPFGWRNSPQIYSSPSNAISAFHRGHRPPDPEVNGEEPYVSLTYVDDGMLMSLR